MSTSTLGVIGTGRVGQALAFRAAEVGYEVTVGARSADSASLAPFAGRDRIRTGSFADAAASAPLLVNATGGDVSLEALGQAGAANLAGKTLLDVSNELRPTEGGGFPTPTATLDHSIGQRIQQAFPQTQVVKALHTMNNQVMVHPETVSGDHLVFMSGDSDEGKNEVRVLLRSFGWRDEQFLDLGGIDTAATTEMMMPVWMRIVTARGQDAGPFNWAINPAS